MPSSLPSPAPAAAPRFRPSLPAAALGLVLLVGLALRVWLATHDDGIYWPDEIFQSFEPAHRLVFGYGLVAWEFLEGARNWTFPALLAGFLKLFWGLGLRQPAAYIAALKILLALVNLAAAPGIYALARRLGAGAWASLAGASVWALGAVPLYFAPRGLTESASAAPVIWAFYLLLPLAARRAPATAEGLSPSPSRGDWWPFDRLRASGGVHLVFGASLLGIAVLLRLQNAIFCVAILAILAGRRRWSPLAWVLGVLAFWAFAYGLIDRVSWGGWFHSAIVYLKFNLVEGKSAGWGTADAGYYVRILARAMPASFLALVLFGAVSIRRAPGLFLTTVAYFALHMAIPHKELRFILPTLPLLCASLALGLEAARAVLPLGVGAASVLATSVWSAASFHHLTFGELGAYEDSRPQSSAYDDFGVVNRLLLAAHDQPDLCGIKVEIAHQAWTGGYTYLHRDMPFYPHTGPGRESGYYNYVITLRRATGGGEVRAEEGPLALVKLFNSPCRPDPNYSWRLP